jgi:hypothetical protein
MKDDEVLAHYARAGDGPPGVIPIGQLAERALVAPPQPSILRTNAAPSVSDQGPAVSDIAAARRHSTKKRLPPSDGCGNQQATPRQALATNEQRQLPVPSPHDSRLDPGDRFGDNSLAGAG